MRHAGQNYEPPVALPEGDITQASLDALAEGSPPRIGGCTAVAEEEPVQLVTFR
jgi:N-methylhydantoinase A